MGAGALVLKLVCILKGLLKYSLLGSTPRVSDLGLLGWNLRICTSNKVSGDAAAAGPRTILLRTIGPDCRGPWILNSWEIQKVFPQGRDGMGVVLCLICTLLFSISMNSFLPFSIVCFYRNGISRHQPLPIISTTLPLLISVWNTLL